jgi:ABC-2 type transport system permease protein
MRAFWHTLKLSLSVDLEYRVAYLILVFSSILVVLMDSAVLRGALLSSSATIPGGVLRWDTIFSFVLIGQIVRQAYTLWSLPSEFVEEIRSGTFRRYLLQPISFTSYYAAKCLGPKLPTLGLSVLACVLLPQWHLFSTLFPNLWSVLSFASLMLVACALSWLIYLWIVLAGFWIEEAGFLTVAFNLGVGIFSGSLVPLSWLPHSLQIAIQWTPLPLLGDLPVRAALGAVDMAEWQSAWIRGVVWLVLLYLGAEQLRRRAFNRYEAFGG